VRHLKSIFILFDNAFNDYIVKEHVSPAKRLTTDKNERSLRWFPYKKTKRGTIDC